ncbi:cytochrome-c peroxidase [Flavitalea antarctica]
MKSRYLAFVILSGIIVTLSLCSIPENKPAVSLVHYFVGKGFDSLDQWVSDDFITVIETGDSVRIRQGFLEGRRIYKNVEFAVEYFFPNASRNINGPALPEIEPEEHTVIEPGGFQVIEEFLYPTYDTSQQKELIRETLKLRSVFTRLMQLWPETKFRDDQVFDALRQECFRILALGISGFDSPLALNSINELPASLQSIIDILNFYKGDQPLREKTQSDLSGAISYAKANPDFNSFDRMSFIMQYVNPATTALLGLQKSLEIDVLTNVYALRGDLKTLFDSSAFNPDFFSPDANAHLSREKIALGRKLFHESLLSDNNQISCASCHKPEFAFTDGLPKSAALGGQGFLRRNTPTIINAGLQKRQFYDMRSTYLEDQVRDVISNKDEIHGSLETAVVKLKKDTCYIRLFKDAFPKVNDSLNQRQVQVALASYIRSKTSLNSRFDQYMRGRSEAMNSEEIKGFNLFMGKAKCGICHFMPTFNGTVPPAFVLTESEVIGVPQAADEKKLDPDPGRFEIHKIPNYEFAFKTPGLRNVALTAPYMHNGVYSTLEEVVEFYNRGGGVGLGFTLPYQTLPPDSLGLDQLSKQALIAFLKTLTDTGASEK